MPDDSPADPPSDRQAQVEAFRARIDAYAELDWTALLAAALQTRESWDHACAELEDSDAPPGPRDADPWSPWQVINHFGGFLRGIDDALEQVLKGEAATPAAGAGGWAQWLGDDLDFSAVRTGAIQAWDRFIGLTMQGSSAQGASGSLALPGLGSLSAKQLIGAGLLHAIDHSNQIRQIRGLAPDENPGDASGQLGARRQTAH